MPGRGREFTRTVGAVAVGLAAGSRVRAEEKGSDKAEKRICKGHNSCKGKGGCAVPPHDMKDTKNPR